MISRKKVTKRKVSKQTIKLKSNPIPSHLDLSEELTNQQIDNLSPENLIWHVNLVVQKNHNKDNRPDLDTMGNDAKIKYLKKITDRWFHVNMYLKMASEI